MVVFKVVIVVLFERFWWEIRLMGWEILGVVSDLIMRCGLVWWVIVECGNIVILIVLMVSLRVDVVCLIL